MSDDDGRHVIGPVELPPKGAKPAEPVTGGKVIEFRASVRSDREKRFRGLDRCWCSSMKLDREARAVTCAACGKLIDPFDAIVKLADNWDSYDHSIRASQADATRYRKEAAEAKEQAAVARGKARNAEREDPAEQERARLLHGIATACGRIADAAIDFEARDLRHLKAEHERMENLLKAFCEIARFIGGTWEETASRAIWQAREQLDARRIRITHTERLKKGAKLKVAPTKYVVVKSEGDA